MLFAAWCITRKTARRVAQQCVHAHHSGATVQWWEAWTTGSSAHDTCDTVVVDAASRADLGRTRAEAQAMLAKSSSDAAANRARALP